MAVGGIVGSLCASFFSEYLHPSYAFFVCSLTGLMLAFAGMQISTDADSQSEEGRQYLGFCIELKQNIRDIKEALKSP